MIVELVGGWRDGTRMRVEGRPVIVLPPPSLPAYVASLEDVDGSSTEDIEVETWVYRGLGEDNGIAYYTRRGDPVGNRLANQRIKGGAGR